MKRPLIFFLLAGLLGFSAPADAKSSQGSGERPLIIAHYMTWFGLPAISGDWRQWKLALDNVPVDKHHYPDLTLADGRRDIAVAHYPSIGPYDSSDPKLCEYHILLAKLSGIDGFMVNWYGMENKDGSPRYENKGFEQLLKSAEKLGFKICVNFDDKCAFPPYFDFTQREQAQDQAKKTLERVMKTYGPSPGYLNINGRPVLSNFGWTYVNSDSMEQTSFSVKEWRGILSALKSFNPFFIHDHQWDWRKSIEEAGFMDFSDSVYSWIGRKEERISFLTESRWLLQRGNLKMVTATVNPGFDNTPCWGWGGGISMVPRRDGAEFTEQWEEALKYEAGLIHLATWNDFTEGSTIEPTEEYGNQYLKITADYANRMSGSAHYGKYLDVPGRIYRSRSRLEKLIREFLSSPQVPDQIGENLDQAVQLVLQEQFAQAQTVLDETDLILNKEEARAPRSKKLEISLNPQTQDIFAGETGKVKLKIKNASRDAIPVYAELNRMGVPRSWMEDLETSLWIRPGEEKEVEYPIHIPSNAPEGVGRLTAAVDSPYLPLSSNVVFTKVCRPLFLADIEGVNLLEPGKERTLNLSVNIRQKENRKVAVVFSAPSGWRAVSDVKEIELPRSGTVNIPLKISLPENPSGNGVLTVKFAQGNTALWTVSEPYGILRPGKAGFIRGDINGDGIEDFVLANQRIEVHATPAVGGRILEIINRRTGRNQLFLDYPGIERTQGHAWDKWAEYGGINDWFPGDWPGKVWNNDWEVSVSKQGDDAVALILSSKINGNFLISRELLVDAGTPILRLNYELMNLSGEERSVFWTSHPDLAPGSSAGAEDVIVVPITGGGLAKKGFNPRLQKSHFVPGKDWMMAFDSQAHEFIGQIFKASIIEKIGLWEGKEFFTMELINNKMVLPPGGKREFAVDYVVGEGELNQAVKQMEDMSQKEHLP